MTDEQLCQGHGQNKAFKYPTLKFPTLSETKAEEVVFIVPQIHEPLRDSEHDSALHGNKAE